MNSIIQGSCHSGPNNPIAAWLEVSHLRGLQRSRSVRTQSLRWNSTMGILLPTTPRKTICLYPTSCFFISAPLVGWWMGNQGRGVGLSRALPCLTPEVCFLKLIFLSSWSLQRSMESGHTFQCSWNPTIIWWVTIFPYYCQKSVGYCWICDKFFSVSSLEVVQFQRP